MAKLTTACLAGTYGRVYKAVLLPPPKSAQGKARPEKSTLSPSELSPTKGDYSAEALNNPELCMRPGDLPAKEGAVFAIKKFKPDKEGDVQTYAGISQSGIREIMVSSDLTLTVSAHAVSLIENCIIATLWHCARSY